MPYELLHFREADKILRQKRMTKNVQETLKYVDVVLRGSLYRMPLLKIALEDMGWRENGSLAILDGRRYQYKGFWNRIAVEANLSMYEYILEGLFRLQLGFDKGILDMGVLLLTAQRSAKSPLGSSACLVQSEISSLYPTISLPVSVVLFDLGQPDIAQSEEELQGDDVEATPVHLPPVNQEPPMKTEPHIEEVAA